MQRLKLIKKYEAYPEYKDSGVEWVGQIPSQWSIMPMRSIAIENTKKNNNGECQNLLSLSYGKIIEKDITSNEGLLPESFNTYQIVSNGNIVFRLTDLQNDKKSLRVGYVDKENKGIITSAYLAIILNKEINSKFAYYLLHSYDLQKVYYGMGGGVRQTLDFSNFKYLPIIAPEIKEQEKIAKYLDEKTALIDQIIEKKEKQIELLKEKRTAVINQAVTRGLDENVEMVDSDIEWIEKIPVNWEVLKLKYISYVTTSGIFGSETEYNNLIKAKVITTSQISIDGKWKFENIEERFFTRAEYKKYSAKIGDIFVVKSSGSAENIASGKAGYITKHEENTIFGNFLLRIRPKENINPKYIYYFLISNLTKQRIELSVSATTYPNLKIDEYISAKLMVPSNEETDLIVNYLDKKISEIEVVIQNTENSIGLLKEFRTSLISNVVTGKIKVK